MAGRSARCTSKNEDESFGDDDGQTPSFSMDGFAQFACRAIASYVGWRTDAAPIELGLSINSDDEGRGCANSAAFDRIFDLASCHCFSVFDNTGCIDVSG